MDQTDVFELIHIHLDVQFVYEENTEQSEVTPKRLKRQLTPEDLNVLPETLLNDLK